MKADIYTLYTLKELIALHDVIVPEVDLTEWINDNFVQMYNYELDLVGWMEKCDETV